MSHKPHIHFIRAAGAGVHVRIQKGGWPLDWHMTAEEAEALALRLRKAAVNARYWRAVDAWKAEEDDEWRRSAHAANANISNGPRTSPGEGATPACQSGPGDG